MSPSASGGRAPYPALFEPYELRSLTLRNRIVSTPHGPAYAENGMPGERYQRYHEEKAKGGIGMTMFGGSSNISVDSPSLFGQIDVSTDAVVPYFARFAERIHAQGAALMCQITHMGHRTVWDHGHWLPTIAPSATRDKAHRAFPKAMESFDIERVVRDFGLAALRCAEGGLDGCEVSVNSHLANQFLSGAINRRTDDYGGSLENRLRFTVEVFTEVRRRVGADFIVGARFPADEQLEGGLDADECIAAARLLAETGLCDFFDVYVGTPAHNPGLREQIPGMGVPPAPHLEVAARFKQAVGRPVFHAARINDAATADRAIREGMVDLVGMTRTHIADPYFIAKVARGEEHRARPCVGANYCIDRIYMGGEALCLHNAATGREETLPQVVTRDVTAPRRVVVVGAGPGGLEAARVSAGRGHEVVLFEAAPDAGGQLLIAAKAPCRADLIGIVRWLEQEVAELGVDVRYNTLAGVDDVLAERPDVVVIATGGLPNTGIVEGDRHVVSVWDALTAADPPGATVLVYDDHGDHQALSCARTLAERGAAVTLVTPDRMLGEDIGLSNIDPYLTAFDALGIEVVLNTRVRGVVAQGARRVATLRHEFSRREHVREFDAVVVEHGTLPLDDLYAVLAPRSTNLGETDPDALAAGGAPTRARNDEGNFELHRIGDAVTGRNVHAAIHDALRLCMRL